MSGVEIVAAAAAVSLVASGVSAYEQIKTANASADMQAQQLREQQVEVRLQQNQATIVRMHKLEAVLATEEVNLGTRNISLGSGTANALTMSNVSNFLADENADKLNYGAKQLALIRQTEMVWQQRRAQVVNASLGFLKESAGTVMSAFSVPSQSLMDKSSSSVPSTANVSNSYGAQSYMQTQNKQFNLNG